MPETTETIEVRSQLSEVGRANEILSEFWVRLNLPEELEGVVTLALEEVLSNAIRHGGVPGQNHDIRVNLKVDAESFEFEVADNGKEFNPLTLPPFNANASLDERRAGGMGVFLVQKLADEVRYERRGEYNHFFFLKRLSAN